MSTNNGLARSVKIANISMQRLFLEKTALKLSNIPEPSGDPTFRYVGYLFPENVEWLKQNGFDVFDTRIDTTDGNHAGLPLYIITPSDNITLNNEETELSKDLCSNFLDFLRSQFSDDDDDDDDDN